MTPEQQAGWLRGIDGPNVTVSRAAADTIDALCSITRHLLAGYHAMHLVNGSEWWHPSEDDDGLHEPMTDAERAALDALQEDDR